jgi:hypothetical protein
MLVLTHVLIALTSVAFTTYLFVRPSQRKFYVNYGLIAATMASGTWLIIASHAPMLSSCLSGLTYIGAVTFGTILAHYKLVHEQAVRISE